jgi:hypothetical protein
MGPTVFVHIPVALSESDLKWLHTELSRNTYDLRGNYGDWSFLISKDSCKCTLAVVAFGSEAKGSYIDTSENDAYLELLGYIPQASIQLDNYCRSDVKNHPLLAKIAIILTTKFGGVIEVGNSIREVEKSLLPGKTYLQKNSEGYEYYLVDGVFMQAWLKHPNFYLET